MADRGSVGFPDSVLHYAHHRNKTMFSWPEPKSSRNGAVAVYCSAKTRYRQAREVRTRCPRSLSIEGYQLERFHRSKDTNSNDYIYRRISTRRSLSIEGYQLERVFIDRRISTRKSYRLKNSTSFSIEGYRLEGYQLEDRRDRDEEFWGAQQSARPRAENFLPGRYIRVPTGVILNNNVKVVRFMTAPDFLLL